MSHGWIGVLGHVLFKFEIDVSNQVKDYSVEFLSRIKVKERKEFEDVVR